MNNTTTKNLKKIKYEQRFKERIKHLTDVDGIKNKIMESKILCDCGKVAVWDYMPGYSNKENSYSCDDCVPRGCECNHRYVSVDSYHPPLDKSDLPDGIEGKDWKWLEQDKVWCYIDDEGRQYPCVEYDYSEEGYDIDE